MSDHGAEDETFQDNVPHTHEEGKENDFVEEHFAEEELPETNHKLGDDDEEKQEEQDEVGKLVGPSYDDKVARANESSRNAAIHRLLDICAEQNVDVPPELRAQLLNEEYSNITHSAGGGALIYSALSQTYKEARKQEQDRPLFAEFRSIITKLPTQFRPDIDLRIENGSYTVMQDVATEEEVKKAQIETVASSSAVAGLCKKLKMFAKTGRFEIKKKQEEKVIMDGINLRLEHGKMYLVLGAPGCGKSTLLKMIAGLLKNDKNNVVGGSVTINGIGQDNKNVVWENLVTYVDQIDRLHPLLTVKETCEFAFQCRQGGTHRRGHMPTDNKEINDLIEKLDKEGYSVNAILRSMGIKRVEDTFVGDDSTVRGVSGGERKRVTVAEMSCIGAPVECLDEMSTGLDAATTFDIVHMAGRVGRLRKVARVISLLQPPPETVALFDEIILLDKGRIIYTGPVEDIVQHFQDLGYEIPDRMDPADWLQALPSPDGEKFLVQPDEELSLPARTHLTHEQFVQKYNDSKRALEIVDMLNAPHHEEKQKYILGNFTFERKYMNTRCRSLKLLIDRELLLWWRNKYQLRARIFQNLLMGIIVGTLFWQVGADAATQTSDAQSIIGVLFQCIFFVSLGAMLKIGDQINTRGVFYKQQDANFYPTWAFVFGRSIAALPTAIIDALLYGTIIYWFVGLAHDDGASVGNYFVFLLILLLSAFAFGLMFSVISALVRDRPSAMAAMALGTVIMILFSGYTASPDVIPDYWIWVYWCNLFAWLLRALLVNEFQSGKYDEPNPNDPSQTKGDAILELLGFTINGEAFTFDWVWYAILYAFAIVIVSTMASVWFLRKIRYETGKGLSNKSYDVPEESEDEDDIVKIPFKRATLTFKDVHYYVQASTSNDTLELLKGVDGFVEAGKLTALMGSSGAGKTTLMDVLSLRKSSGEVTGEVKVNGHPQESDSFRRCTGYVEQFDTQSPQLTIRETVRFSAKLRLDENDPAVTDESIDKFVTQNLKLLELNTIEDFQVGSDIAGGLSFEQRKRLSIAVELVANPSILFLDEPTSGLDARAAGIVMRGLKRIAESGRAVCATIHQPSVVIFNSFDSLLLLKRGGEPVFFGELGEDSCNLIRYLERYEATPKIKPGENPGTWMLTTIGAGSGQGGPRPFGYAASYAESKLRENALEKIEEVNAQASEENLISYDTKFSTSSQTQMKEVVRRMVKIYWRSPAYNRNRTIVAAIIAFLFGSVYVSQRTPETETDMNSRVNSIFITSLFLGVSSLNTVLPVFEVERNMFYRHKAARMYRQFAISNALTVAEIPFLTISAMVFTICWYFMAGFSAVANKFFLYYLFVLLNMTAFTFVGQMLMSLLKDSTTAQGLGAIFNSMTSLFAGILLRPQNINGFWEWAYWVFPGHYICEGLFTSQYHDDDTPIEASPGSAFDAFVETKCADSSDPNCSGTASEWLLVSFGGKFQYSHVWYDILYMIGLILVAKVTAYWALHKLDYLAK